MTPYELRLLKRVLNKILNWLVVLWILGIIAWFVAPNFVILMIVTIAIGVLYILGSTLMTIWRARRSSAVSDTQSRTGLDIAVRPPAPTVPCAADGDTAHSVQAAANATAVNEMKQHRG